MAYSNFVDGDSLVMNIKEEDDQCKNLRRERNKEAAARCRQRRLEQMERLSQETEELSEGNRFLRNELKLLEEKRNHLQRTLGQHQIQCHSL